MSTDTFHALAADLTAVETRLSATSDRIKTVTRELSRVNGALVPLHTASENARARVGALAAKWAEEHELALLRLVGASRTRVLFSLFAVGEPVSVGMLAFIASWSPSGNLAEAATAWYADFVTRNPARLIIPDDERLTTVAKLEAELAALKAEHRAEADARAQLAERFRELADALTADLQHIADAEFDSRRHNPFAAASAQPHARAGNGAVLGTS